MKKILNQNKNMKKTNPRKFLNQNENMKILNQKENMKKKQTNMRKILNQKNKYGKNPEPKKENGKKSIKKCLNKVESFLSK